MRHTRGVDYESDYMMRPAVLGSETSAIGGLVCGIVV